MVFIVWGIVEFGLIKDLWGGFEGDFVYGYGMFIVWIVEYDVLNCFGRNCYSVVNYSVFIVIRMYFDVGVVYFIVGIDLVNLGLELCFFRVRYFYV